MSDTVKACPECDSTNNQRLTHSTSSASTHDFNYSCRDCGHRFHQPVEREPKGHQNTIRKDTLAARLEAANADEVVRREA